MPCAMGVGVAMVILSLMVAIYYNVIMAYCLHYLFNSMRYTGQPGRKPSRTRITACPKVGAALEYLLLRLGSRLAVLRARSQLHGESGGT